MDEFHNYTTEEVELYLADLQHDSTMAYIPTFVYMFLLILVGLVGNSLVIVVYNFKMTRTPLRIFIVAMAVFDLLTNAIIMPGRTYDLLHVWNFDKPNFCKLRMYLNASLVISSVFVLVAVATMRYLMVCHPFKTRLTIKQAKVVCVIIATVSFFISIPYGLIHGTQTKRTPNPNITARYCQVDDGYVNTIWPRLNSGFFIFVFVVCSSTIIYFYSCIGRATWTGRNALVAIERSSSEGRDSSSKDSDGCNLPKDRRGEVHSEETELSEDDSVRSNEHSPAHISCIPKAEVKTHGVIALQVEAKKDECPLQNEAKKDECIGEGCSEDSNPQEMLDNIEKAIICNTPHNITESSPSHQSAHVNLNSKRDEEGERAESEPSTSCTPDNESKGTKNGKNHTSLDSNKRSMKFQITTSKKQTNVNRRRLFERTSLMMFVITLVFFVGFLPFLGLNVFLALAPENVAALKGVSLAMYQLFLCSYLLNSAANCIVYSFFDRRFRKECLILLKCSKRKLP